MTLQEIESGLLHLTLDEQKQLKMKLEAQLADEYVKSFMEKHSANTTESKGPTYVLVSLSVPNNSYIAHGVGDTYEVALYRAIEDYEKAN